MKTLASIGWFPFLFLYACQSAVFNAPPDVQDSLVAHVPVDQRTEINEAQTRRVESEQGLADAKRDLAEAKSHCDLAYRNQDLMKSRLYQVRERAQHARSFGSDEELATQRQQRGEFEAALRLADARVGYYENLRELAERRVELLEQRRALANGRFEFAKATAVAGLSRPIAKTIDVDDYRHAVARLEHDFESARIAALASREHVTLRARFLEQIETTVPETLRFGPVERIDSLFEDEAYRGDGTGKGYRDAGSDKSDRPDKSPGNSPGDSGDTRKD